ncbi:putative aminohydrolase SsnA [Clostridium sp.]|uniref:putative aminohydrolase SsnA n=1 Tax=Clostridium sp. TaxID=1506 RepID=UPI0029036C43|nr:putative aminohydrolase SsnA [Clostridium sp.]MBS7129378.1 putative aminohydrolase SsnA [Clostridium sp.]MDU2282515.1 putative aminohydrolase SsnA [Clostridium sp.]
MLIGNGRLITHDKKNSYLEDGCIYIDGNIIKEVGKTKDLKDKYLNEEFIDAKGNVIMPGIINPHHHIYSAFARGMNLNNPTAKGFIDILENLWWRLDKELTIEDTRYSGYTTLIDCIKYGVTTVFDHHASPMHLEGSVFELGDVAKELGIRACLCYETSDRDGEEILNKGIKENIDFIKHANNQDDDMIKGMFGMHASFTLSDESLYKCAEAMEGIDSGYHIHTAEGIDDVYDSLRRSGKRVAERLMDFDILGNKTLAVHSIHLNPRELDLIKATKTNIVNNPESNMGNAVGCAPVLNMIERGINVGLGTDGYTSDMFESMKVENIIQKHNLCDSNVAWVETPKMIFENNAKIANKFFNNTLGVIEEGAYGDVIIVEYNPLTPMTKDNYNSHIVFGMCGKSVLTTIVNGKVLMKNRELMEIDEEKIFSKSRELSKKLWDRI